MGCLHRETCAILGFDGYLLLWSLEPSGITENATGLEYEWRSDSAHILRRIPVHRTASSFGNEIGSLHSSLNHGLKKQLKLFG